MTDSYNIFSEAITWLFQKYAHFERKRERERWNVRVSIICIPTNNETVNLVLLQKHVVAEKYNRFRMETILLQ